MNTIVEHTGGTGINGRYRIHRNGEIVAFLTRYGATSWRLYSKHYYEPLASYPNINMARKRATEFEAYPNAEEVYERICQRIETTRRAWKRQQMAAEMADAANELAAGSNTAHDRLVEMAREIEAFAKDRSDRQKVFMDEAGKVTDFRHGVTVYPEPPYAKTRSG